MTMKTKLISCLLVFSFLVLTSCSGGENEETPPVQLGTSVEVMEVGNSKGVELPQLDNLNRIEEMKVKIVITLGDNPREVIVSDELSAVSYNSFAVAFNEVYECVDTHLTNLYEHLKKYRSNAEWLAVYEVMVNEFETELDEALEQYKGEEYSKLESFTSLKDLEFPTVESIVFKENQSELKSTLKSYLKTLGEVGYLPEELVSSEEYCELIEQVSEEYGVDPANYGKVFGVNSDLYKELRGI